MSAGVEICRGCGTEGCVDDTGLCALCVPFLVATPIAARRDAIAAAFAPFRSPIGDVVLSVERAAGIAEQVAADWDATNEYPTRCILLDLAEVDPDDGSDYRCMFCRADLYRDEEDGPVEPHHHASNCVWRRTKELIVKSDLREGKE